MGVRPAGAAHHRSTPARNGAAAGRGRPAAACPTLGAVFTLCGGAHRVAPRQTPWPRRCTAVRAAPSRAAPGAAGRHAARAPAPPVAGRACARARRAQPTCSLLAQCPLCASRCPADNCSRAVARAPGVGCRWPIGCKAGRPTRPLRRMQPGATPAATAGRRACWPRREPAGSDGHARGRPLQAPASPRCRGWPSACARAGLLRPAPTWRGQPAETGLDTPGRPTAVPLPLHRCMDAPGARFADVLRLAAPQGRDWLAEGALAAGARRGHRLVRDGARAARALGAAGGFAIGRASPIAGCSRPPNGTSTRAACWRALATLPGPIAPEAARAAARTTPA
jgi:hypothetical protein